MVRELYGKDETPARRNASRGKITQPETGKRKRAAGKPVRDFTYGKYSSDLQPPFFPSQLP